MDPELSLIFCSRAHQLPEQLLTNIKQTIGCSYELVVIDNSEGNYSIFEAYQKGYEESKAPYLAFLHDDILFHTENWGLLLINHLSAPGTGICGIGGRDTLVRVPASWTVSLPYIHLIQSVKNGQKRKIKHRPEDFQASKAPVIMLDGVVLCMPRSLMEVIRFDTSLTGFHGYDFDSCIQAAAAGFQNYVMYDISIEHFSRGNSGMAYYRNLIQVFANHTHQLPLSTGSLTKEQQLRLEKRGIQRLVRKMAVKGFSTNEIIQTCKKFSGERKGMEGLPLFTSPFSGVLIHVQVGLIRLLYRPSLLFRKSDIN